MFDVTGERIARSGLREKWWVRAEGTVLADPHRIKVHRLDVIAKDQEAFQRTAFWTNGREHGYVERVASARQNYP
jgi:hypothetical protein